MECLLNNNQWKMRLCIRKCLVMSSSTIMVFSIIIHTSWLCLFECFWFVGTARVLCFSIACFCWCLLHIMVRLLSSMLLITKKFCHYLSLIIFKHHFTCFQTIPIRNCNVYATGNELSKDISFFVYYLQRLPSFSI